MRGRRQRRPKRDILVAVRCRGLFGAAWLAVGLAAACGGGAPHVDAGRDTPASDTGKDARVDSAVDTPADAPTDAIDAPTDGTGDSATDTTVDAPATDTPADVPVDTPVDTPVDAPADVPVDTPADAATDTSTDGGIEAPPACDVTRTLSLGESQAYTPLAVGNRWTYRGLSRTPNRADLEFQQRVIVKGMDADGGAPAFAVDEIYPTANRATVTHRLDVSGTGLIDHGTTPAGYDMTAAPDSPPFPEIRFPIAVCSTYQQFSYLHTNGTYTGTATERAFEPVQVKVGLYADALRHERVLNFRTADARLLSSYTYRTTDWYAPGVGRVKRFIDNSGYDYAFELTGWMIGGVGRGVVPLDSLTAATLHVEGSPLGENLPAAASDGSNFLVVQPFNTGYYQGGLQAFVIRADGTLASSAPVLSGSTAPHDAGLAYGSGHYLVTFPEVNQPALRAMFVTPAGAAEGPAFAIGSGSWPGAVAYGGGVFAIARVGAMGIIIDIVNPLGGVVAETIPYNSENQYDIPAAIASDGSNFLVAWTTRETGSGGSLEATHLVAARIDAAGRALDAAATPVSMETGVDEGLDMAFDGTRYVVSWFHRTQEWLLGVGTVRAARFSTSGVLLDGAPAPAGGHALSFTGGEHRHPRIVRFGSRTFVVWEAKPMSAGPRIVGTRLGDDGTPLDSGPNDEGIWITHDFPYAPAVASNGDHALLVSYSPAGNYEQTFGHALLFPF